VDSSAAPAVDDEPELKQVTQELTTILADMLAVERRFDATWQGLPEAHRDSARNLLHYLALRRRDLRSMQAHLAARGLSSLGRAEAQVCANVEAVLHALERLAHAGAPLARPSRRVAGFARGHELLEAHTRALLGPPPAGRDVRIMVTVPGEAADDPRLVRGLLDSGMDCLRINTAHDDAVAWERMLSHLQRAQQETGRPCRILMDLAGPKLRTGPIQPGPPIVKWRPRRDAYGRVTQPARIWFTSRDQPVAPPESADAILPVPGDWLAALRSGEIVRLFDARDAARTVRVVACTDGGAWGEAQKTAYVMPGTRLRVSRKAMHEVGDGRICSITEVGELPPTPQAIVLAAGDTLVVLRELVPGTPAILGAHGELLQPASVSVTLPEIFDDVHAEETMWLDDGKIGGVIRRVEADRLEVTITHARSGGSKLLSDKGINLPDSDLRLPSLTSKDVDDLPFIAAHADIVGYSFVRSEADVRALQSHLSDLGGERLGLVLKIETRRAFEQLPTLLLAAMRSAAAGVMIARGDLAVECGYERLAEVQEEILWMAEASHVPVIWATQVLEHLAKDGLPSRAEITDAAMGERAECVMLNKGPYVLDALRTLDNILRRMQTHQRKKRAMLRQLGLADRFLEPMMVQDVS
jgi:pyruvate kinase